MPSVKTFCRIFSVVMLFAVANGAQVTLASGLPGLAAADTIHTNLWLTEALMAEIVTAAAVQMPPPPAAVRLVAAASGAGNTLFQAVAWRVLDERGYSIYVAEDDSTRQGAVDFRFGFEVEDIHLSYPDVGRTLGLWRRWVSRELSVSVLMEITEESSGHLLFNERLRRGFADRVGSSALDAVDSNVYPFTTAQTLESGWRGRVEEVVVLGTLAGLVAIYFANTGN